MFLPWFVVGRTQFIWYMLPAVPFMCLGVVDDASADAREPRTDAGDRVRRRDGRRGAAVPAGVDRLAVADSWIRAIEWLPDWPL